MLETKSQKHVLTILSVCVFPWHFPEIILFEHSNRAVSMTDVFYQDENQLRGSEFITVSSRFPYGDDYYNMLYVSFGSFYFILLL